jgi:hypothetical protein
MGHNYRARLADWAQTEGHDMLKCAKAFGVGLVAALSSQFAVDILQSVAPLG